MDTKEIKTSTFSQVLLWFGAAVSISELMTGALIAPLGLEQGILAILIGHVIGALVLFPAGLIGAESGLSWAESTRISFGKYGSYGFSVINIMQLLGWTAVMIISAAKAFDGIVKQFWSYQNEPLWCIAIGLFICLWIVVGLKNLSKLNVVVITLLFICTIVLSFTDYFLLHQRKIRPQNSLNIKNLILWLIGFFAYRLLMSYNTVVGITLPIMLGLVAISYIWGIAERKTHEQKI